MEFERRVLPAEHPDIATSMNNLATTYSHLGRHEEALQLRRSLEARICAAAPPPGAAPPGAAQPA